MHRLMKSLTSHPSKILEKINHRLVCGHLGREAVILQTTLALLRTSHKKRTFISFSDRVPRIIDIALEGTLI